MSPIYRQWQTPLTHVNGRGAPRSDRGRAVPYRASMVHPCILSRVI